MTQPTFASQYPKANAHAKTFSAALSLHRKGEVAAAERMYRAVLKADPNHFGALHNLGFLYFQRSNAKEAIKLFRRALNQNPKSTEALNNLGAALAAVERHEEAIERYERALAIKPDFAEALNNLAVSLVELHRNEEAIAHCERALAINANFADAHTTMGKALTALGRDDEAKARYERAVAIGGPRQAEAYYRLGNTLVSQDHYPEAVASLGKALAIKPDYVDAYFSLGLARSLDGRPDEAIASLRRAIALKPQHAASRWTICTLQLPVIYRTVEEIESRTSAYRRELETVVRHYETADRRALADAADQIGRTTSFYLAYQGRTNRDLQATLGELTARIMAARYPEFSRRPTPPRRSASSPIRVGILSGFFRWHSNWKIPLRGWAEGLSHDRFELFGYHTFGGVDAVTDVARGCCKKFVQGPKSVETWCSTIRQDELDILLIPETGMDAMTMKLAALWLAPVQATSWGHPITSGLPTIDYFLSSDLMEPPDAQDHYTEELVRLPNLGIGYQPVKADECLLTRDELGFSEKHVLYWSCQSLYKYLPQYDWIFPAISAEVPEARFLFIRHSSDFVTSILRERLTKAFEVKGLSAERYCRFLDRMDFARFSAVARASDVFLDNPGWSGCNSTLEAMATNLPIVSHRGALMRARHSAAILEMMGMSDLAADTVEDFVETAIGLGRDTNLRQHMRERIAASKELIYHDNAPILGLEDFIQRAVER